MDVYIDLYFLINAGMDFICLLITGIILRREISAIRGIVAAICGGIWACVSLLFGFEGLLSIFADLFVGGLLSWIVFYEKGMKFWRFCRNTVLFLINSMLLGGIMTVLFSFLNRLHLPFESMENDDLSIWLFAAVGALSGVITLLGSKLKRKTESKKTVKITISLFGKEVELNALVDSGNLLEDPVSGKSVFPAEWKKLSPLFPEITLRNDKPLYQRLCENPKIGSKIRLIPTQTAVGSQLLPAFQPDRIRIEDNGETVTVSALIALTDLPTRTEDFDAIISPIT